MLIDYGYYADPEYCHTCAASGDRYCSWELCYEACGCDSLLGEDCCSASPCEGGGGPICASFCQVGRVSLLAALLLSVLMGVSIYGCT